MNHNGVDIFISYAREDEERIRQLADALEAVGWSVFWDRRIPAGKTWRSYIGRALSDAGCVIVAWSRYSTASEWVIEEAGEAQKRDVLIPVLLEDVEPPIGFRGIQAADLISWQQGCSSPHYNYLIRDIKAVLKRTPKLTPSVKPDGTESTLPIFLVWILANSLSGAFGESFVGSVGASLFGLGGWVLFKTFFGICVGAGQYLGLRQWAIPPKHWVLFGAVSGALAAMPAFTQGILSWEQFGLSFGILLGIFQAWLVGKARFAIAWILMCGIGGGLGGVTAPILSTIILGPSDPLSIQWATIAGASFGLVFGLFTAVPLVFLKGLKPV